MINEPVKFPDFLPLTRSSLFVGAYYLLQFKDWIISPSIILKTEQKKANK